MILYFSATGNSRYVAAALAQALGEQTLVDLRPYMKVDAAPLTITLSAGETLGFVFPVHSWGMPKYLAEVLTRMHVKGYVAGENYTYMLSTCGDDVGYLPKQWNSVMQKAGIATDAAFSLIMPNTYVLFPGFDVDAPAVSDRKLAEAPAAVRRIADRIVAREKGDFTHRGSVPALKTNVIYPLFVRYATSDKSFRADADACIGCGQCVQSCPVGNITLTRRNPGKEDRYMPEWQGRCLTCMACYHYCPTHAIGYGSKTKGKHFYTCPL